MDAEQMALLPALVVHCFDRRCRYTVSADDPYEAHARMERHYDEVHAAYIRKVAG